MRNVVRYRLEIVVFDGVVGFCKTHELIVACRLKSSRYLSHHLEAAVECLGGESLLDSRTNCRGHNVCGVCRSLDPLGLGCESKCNRGYLLGILPQLLLP